MTEQLRTMVKNALVARQPVGPNGRIEIYEDLRQRLNRFAVGRSPPLNDQQKSRLIGALDSAIAEIEGRFSIEEPPVQVSPPHHDRRGEMSMTTSVESKNTTKAGSRNAIIAAGIAILAVVAGGGWYWWSQQYDATTKQRLSDLQAVKAALEKYHQANGAYPVSSAWDGLHSQWGESTEEWIQGLAPTYIATLPLDPTHDNPKPSQYLYRSDGKDYKLIAHHTNDCDEIRRKESGLVDSVRNKDDGGCWGYGYWTEGAARW